MPKGVDVKDVIQSIRQSQGDGAAREFAARVKRESGVDVTFTVAQRGRKRKHRWDNAQGRVIAIRLPDSVYAVVERRAKSRGLSVGDWVKVLIRQQHIEFP